MNLRILAALAEDEAAQDAEHSKANPDFPGLLQIVPPQDGAPLAQRLARVPQRWICTSLSRPEKEITPEAISLLDANSMRRVGYAEIGLPDGRKLEFWRRDALIGLAESTLLESIDDVVTLNRWKPFYGAQDRSETVSRATRLKRGVAALISRNGAELCSGGEHFLDNVADHHNRQGFEPIIVGTRGDIRSEERTSKGRRCVFIGDSVAELRKLFLENDVSLVHAISGAGFPVAEALSFTNIPFVYGVHFWNELLGDHEHTGYFDEVTGGGRFRREFLLILSRATAIYANSRFTQKIIEEGFGVRCPIVYAVPSERA
jgi:hypothetical protein